MRSVVVLLFLLVLVAVGCGPSGPKLVKVSGKVTVGGNPAVSAMIAFHPEDGSTPAVADVGSDGSYELTLGGTEAGATIGKHKVRVICRSSGSVEEGQSAAPPCKVPGKYWEIETSGLTAEVKDEANVIDFSLDAK